MPDWHLHHGDCLNELRKLSDASVDALVTDPPAGIEFMGADWDTFKQGRLSNYGSQPSGHITDSEVGFKDFRYLPNIASQRANVKCRKCGRYRYDRDRKDGCPTWADHDWAPDHSTRDTFLAFMTAVVAECLRVLKPGAHGLVWALPRTSHWTATALEDAGFEVRDVVHHLFGSGFPKSLDVSKAIDAQVRFGGSGSRQLRQRDGRTAGVVGTNRNLHRSGRNDVTEGSLSMPVATSAAREWSGWGTALKPATEHWILVRKPLSEPNVASNVLRHATGALNIDGCRVHCADKTPFPTGHSKATGNAYAQDDYSKSWMAGEDRSPNGRFPANLVLSHSEGCVPVGTRRVRGAGWRDEDVSDRRGSNTYNAAVDGSMAGPGGRHYADADGTEEGEAWECEPGCPVAELDRQSSAGRIHEADYKRAGGPMQSGVGGLLGVGSGGASRFFATFRSESCESANTVGQSSDQPSPRDGSVQSDAATLGNQEVGPSPPLLEPSTSATLTESRGDYASGTPTIHCSDARCSSEWPHDDDTVERNHASNVAPSTQTGIIRTMTVPSTSDGCVEPVMSDYIFENSEAGDRGSAPRFRYTAKASTSERNAGLDDAGTGRNLHPTVKPIALMRYLCRLVTPSGGTVLDPFAGSGSTGVACIEEGFNFIGIERESEYVAIANARLEHAARQPRQVTLPL